MKRLAMLLALSFIGLQLNCDNEMPMASSDDNSAMNWNSLRSNWKESKSCSKESEEAEEAFSEYLDLSSGGNTASNIDHFQITLTSVVENADGTQTWTYSISKTASGSQAKDLSHFGLNLPDCVSSEVSDTLGGSYGPDPSNSCSGSDDWLKWDRSVGENEVVEFSFTTSEVFPLGEVTGLVKYSTSCNVGTLPGPACNVPGGDDEDGEDGDDDNDNEGEDGDDDNDNEGEDDDNEGEGPGDTCPSWIDTLNLTSTVTYKSFHGYNNLHFPVYYVGETMHADLKICNQTNDNATGLKVATIIHSYPNGGLACGNPVQTWTGVTIAANDCLTLDHSFKLETSCAWGNYESHLMVTREADGNCPVAALIVDNGAVGFFDP